MQQKENTLGARTKTERTGWTGTDPDPGGAGGGGQ